MIKRILPNKNQTNLPPGVTQKDESGQQMSGFPSGMASQMQSPMDSIQLSQSEPQKVDTSPGQPTMDQTEKNSMMNESSRVIPLFGEKSTQPWFSQDEVDDLRSRWIDIQVEFVNSPCSAIEQGDALVAEALEHVKQAMADRQTALNQLWLNHDDISTEELRLAMQEYRAFLNQILNLG